MHVSFTIATQTETQRIFFINSLKIKSEGEHLISSGAFFQGWQVLYAILSRPNIFVLGC